MWNKSWPFEMLRNKGNGFYPIGKPSDEIVQVSFFFFFFNAIFNNHAIGFALAGNGRE